VKNWGGCRCYRDHLRRRHGGSLTCKSGRKSNVFGRAAGLGALVHLQEQSVDSLSFVAICSLPALCSHKSSIVALYNDLARPLIRQRAFLQCNTPTSQAESSMVRPSRHHTSNQPVCLSHIRANKENNFMASASADRSMLSPHLSLQLFVT